MLHPWTVLLPQGASPEQPVSPACRAGTGTFRRPSLPKPLGDTSKSPSCLQLEVQGTWSWWPSKSRAREVAELCRLPEDKVLETTCSIWEGEESQAGRICLWQHRHPTASNQKEKHHLVFQNTGKGWAGAGEVRSSLKSNRELSLAASCRVQSALNSLPEL